METITQTNRTILFAEINPERLNLLTLVGDVRGKSSLDDDKIKEINYGAVANKPGSKAFDQSVFLTPEEQADTQKLLDMGIKIYSQQTPTFKVVPIDHT